MGIDVIIAMNYALDKSETEAEFDDARVAEALTDVFKQHNLDAIAVEADERITDIFRLPSPIRPPFVFNIAEGRGGDSREAQVPGLLEFYRIPYSGSGLVAQAVSLDKKVTKIMAANNGVATAKFQLFNSPYEDVTVNFMYPVIVKPNSEGSGIGISTKSKANNLDELRAALEYIIGTYHQPALVEEFLPGREFTVALYGDKDKLYRMPILEIFVDKYKGQGSLATFAAKYEIEEDIHSGLADIDKELREKIYQMAEKTFRAVGARDYARVDIRLGEDGNPYLLEVNLLPGIHPDVEHVSYFTKICRLAGLDYNPMINGVLHFATARYDNKVRGLFNEELLMGAFDKIKEIDVSLRD